MTTGKSETHSDTGSCRIEEEINFKTADLPVKMYSERNNIVIVFEESDL